MVEIKKRKMLVLIKLFFLNETFFLLLIKMEKIIKIFPNFLVILNDGKFYTEDIIGIFS